MAVKILNTETNKVVGTSRDLKTALLKAGGLMKKGVKDPIVVQDLGNPVNPLTYWPLTEGDTHIGWEDENGRELDDFNAKYF